MFNEVSTFSCSNHQSPEIQSIEKIIHYCTYGCGNEAIIKLKNDKWCCSKSSNSCPNRKKKKVNKIQKDCPICNKKLFTTPYIINNHITLCKRNKELDKLIITKKCQVCNKEFQTDNNHRYNKCCSRKCANKISTQYNKGKIKIVKCKECNTNIEVKINSTNYNNLCKICKINKLTNINNNIFSKIKECYSINKKPFFKRGFHITWNNKKIFYRSNYELEYAQKLDKEKVEYFVEYLHIKYFDTILNKERIAIPDFYISSTNTIIEIKSYFTLNIQNMKDKIKSYLDLGYNFKLIINKEEVNIDDL